MKNQIPYEDITKTIRGLSIDAIEVANSGHPGLPLGCAEIAAYLFAEELIHNPKNPSWINRDRFVLSAGHGSMLLYSCLHLAGFAITLEDIKKFRTLHSITAGHPELSIKHGIETTTGPLGQGIAIATGFALGDKIKQARLGLENSHLLNNQIIVLAGDGCMMEGVSSEACSLAGHLELSNLTIIYDSNDICLDGPTSECFTENVADRFKSYNWNVEEIDGHNITAVKNSLSNARKQNKKPSLIIAKTKIGKGSPNRVGTSEVHGKALGQEELTATKKNLDISIDRLFTIPNSVKEYFLNLQRKQLKTNEKWNEELNSWLNEKNENKTKWQQLVENNFDYTDSLKKIKTIPIKSNIASRSASSTILQYLKDEVPSLIGGSADLSCSDNSMMNDGGVVQANNFNARNIKYGVREFAMASISNGLALTNILPFCATFLTFSDYMRNAIRLACLMNIKVFYQFTHDSIFLGEDGPTHQPIEHLNSLRAIPNLNVIRPADNTEVKAAWTSMLNSNSPCALILSRQKLNDLDNSCYESAQKGAYVIKKEKSPIIDIIILATGSEVNLALETEEVLSQENLSVRVVSFPCFEIFEKQSEEYRNKVLPSTAKLYCSIEAGNNQSWFKYIGKDGISISIEEFGLSAPANKIKEYFKFDKHNIVKRLLSKLSLVKK